MAKGTGINDFEAMEDLTVLKYSKRRFRDAMSNGALQAYASGDTYEARETWKYARGVRLHFELDPGLSRISSL